MDDSSKAKTLFELLSKRRERAGGTKVTQQIEFKQKRAKKIHNSPKQRRFISYEFIDDDKKKHEITTNELKGLDKDDRTFLLENLNEMQHLEINDVQDHKSYVSYSKIYEKFGRFRFDQFRVYTLKMCEGAYLILEIKKKKKDEFSKAEKEKLIKRIKFYESNFREAHQKRYCKKSEEI